MRGGAVALQPVRQFPGIRGEQADTAMARRRANAPGLIGAVQHETGAYGHFDIAEGVVLARRGRCVMLGHRLGGASTRHSTQSCAGPAPESGCGSAANRQPRDTFSQGSSFVIEIEPSGGDIDGNAGGLQRWHIRRVDDLKRRCRYVPKRTWSRTTR